MDIPGLGGLAEAKASRYFLKVSKEGGGGGSHRAVDGNTAGFFFFFIPWYSNTTPAHNKQTHTHTPTPAPVVALVDA